jgi:ABC-2 type transport system ATP-binding protein
VFLTTHYIDEAENTDRVCVISHGKNIFSGSPEKMKEKFIRQELILDADNRSGLEKELRDLGLQTYTDKHIIVLCEEWSAQEIISRLQTKLSLLKIHEPSLEDAYMELLTQAEGGTE